MIPKECYLYQTGYDQVANENQSRGIDYLIDIKEGVKQGYFLSSPSADGQTTVYTLIPNKGLWLPVVGALFPVKSFPEPSAIFAANLVKSLIIDTIKLTSRWYLAPFLLLVNKQQAVDTFNRISFKALSPQMMTDECLTDFTREFKTFLYTFLKELGFTEESSFKFALIFSHLIEFDNVYRLRLADTFSETSVDKLLRPQKEISRLTEVMRSREVRPGGKGEAIHRKFNRMAFLIRLFLLIPKVKRAYSKALQMVDFTKLQLDQNDIYWLCFRNDYKWMGLTDDERKEYASNRGWTYPEPVDVR